MLGLPPGSVSESSTKITLFKSVCFVIGFLVFP
jgi:hypothetical protein